MPMAAMAATRQPRDRSLPATGAQTEDAAKTQGPRRQHAHADGRHLRARHQPQRLPAQRQHLLGGDAQPKQRHTDAQQLPREANSMPPWQAPPTDRKFLAMTGSRANSITDAP